jgi:RNA polymerase sigma-70 factor (family 1)
MLKTISINENQQECEALLLRDKTAFRQLFDKLYPSLTLFALNFVKQTDVAEDLAQDAFIKLWKHIDQFQNINQLKGFLYTVTRNACLNYNKHQKVVAKFHRDNIVYEIGENRFTNMIIEQETFRMVHEAISKLSQQNQKIIRLSLDGHKNHDIALELNISVNTVKTLKARSYAFLREQLKHYYFLVPYIIWLSEK